MFREIDPEPEFRGLEDDDWMTHGDPRLLACETPLDYQRYLEAAAKHKVRYEFELEGLLRRYNISEAECVAGLLLRSPKTRVRVEKDHDIRIAVREAYAHVVAGTRDRIRKYLEDHPSGSGKEVDLDAWALAAYKLTYDYSERFSSYRQFQWSVHDFDTADSDEVNAEVEEEFRAMLADQNISTSLCRRYSFAWILSEHIFHLLGELEDS
ncbi:hypothetical protein BDY19DRAFT_667054 [Irpex rosettiformis]|uniref:Uncharacterized protein n=1 Tax=Irpex rosettiformis TaxID=378272 RepID=A0ACB8U9N1_9APHY|nr:hypothetical protein BDY19DRAFT_667054 [Irpex rosettiformis]